MQTYQWGCAPPVSRSSLRLTTKRSLNYTDNMVDQLQLSLQMLCMTDLVTTVPIISPSEPIPVESAEVRSDLI